MGGVGGATLALAASAVAISSVGPPPLPPPPPLPAPLPGSAQGVKIGNNESLVVLNVQTGAITANFGNVITINALFAAGTVAGTVDLLQTPPSTCAATITNPLQALVGTWAFSTKGFAPSTQPLASSGQFKASISSAGVGVLTVTDTASRNGQITRLETDAGTFQVFPDCSGGSLRFNLSTGPAGFDFGFVNAGSELFFTTNNLGDITDGSARRADCTRGCICVSPIGCPCCSSILLPPFILLPF